MHAVAALLSATVQVADTVFERHSPFDPHDVGERLAAGIDTYVREGSLGYYPALDYFQETGVLEAPLLEVLDQLVWLETSLVGEELRSRLRGIFSSVQVQSMQAVVYSMPQVRPSQANAVRELARHLTPNRARFDLRVTLLRKQADIENLDTYIGSVVQRHLSEAFDKIEIGNVTILQ